MRVYSHRLKYDSHVVVGVCAQLGFTKTHTHTHSHRFVLDVLSDPKPLGARWQDPDQKCYNLPRLTEPVESSQSSSVRHVHGACVRHTSTPSRRYVAVTSSRPEEREEHVDLFWFRLPADLKVTVAFRAGSTIRARCSDGPLHMKWTRLKHWPRPPNSCCISILFYFFVLFFVLVLLPFKQESIRPQLAADTLRGWCRSAVSAGPAALFMFPFFHLSRTGKDGSFFIFIILFSVPCQNRSCPEASWNISSLWYWDALRTPPSSSSSSIISSLTPDTHTHTKGPYCRSLQSRLPKF